MEHLTSLMVPLSWLALTDVGSLLLKVTALLALGLAVSRLLPQLTAAVRHQVLTFSLWGAALLPLMALALPDWSMGVDVPMPPTEPVVSPVSPSPEVPLLVEVESPRDRLTAERRGLVSGVQAVVVEAVPAEEAAPAVPAVPDLPSQPVMATEPLSSGPPHVYGVLLRIWMAGALLMGLHLLLARLRLWYMVLRSDHVEDPALQSLLVRESEHLDLGEAPQLRQGEIVRVPQIGGSNPAVLLLPQEASSWPTERVQLVLRHELAHLRRRDPQVVVVSRVALAVFWFHPLAWWVERDARRACEAACDDLVLSAGARASDYAAHLLAIARGLTSRDGVPVTSLASVRRSELEDRIMALLDPNRPRRGSRLSMGMGAALAALLLSPLAALRLEANPSLGLTASELAALDDIRGGLSPVGGLDPLQDEGKAFASGGLIADRANPPQGAASNLPPPKGWSVGTGSKAVAEGSWSLVADMSRSSQAFSSGEGEASASGGASDQACSTCGAPSTLLAHRGEGESSSDPWSGSEWYDKAFELYNDERFELAGAAFEKAAQKGHSPALSWFNAACSYGLAGMADASLTALNEAARAGLDRVDYLTRDSDLDAVRGDPRFAEALTLVRANAERSGNDEDGDYKRVMRAYQLLEAHTRDGDQWFDVGTELLAMRELDKAIPALEKAAELEAPNNDTALYNLACAYAIKGDKAAALGALERAIDAGFTDAEHIQTDDDLRSLREEERFKQLVQKARELDLDSWTAWAPSRDLYSRTRWLPAIEHFEQYVQLSPLVGQAWFNLGYSLHYSRQHEPAAAAFIKAAELGFKTQVSQYNAACAFAMAGKQDEAFTWLGRSLDSGYDILYGLKEDDDLKSLRKDPRMDELKARAEAHHQQKVEAYKLEKKAHGKDKAAP